MWVIKKGIHNIINKISWRQKVQWMGCMFHAKVLKKSEEGLDDVRVQRNKVGNSRMVKTGPPN